MFDYDAWLIGMAEEHYAEPSYDHIYEEVADDTFESVCYYSDGDIIREYDNRRTLGLVYEDIEDMKEEGLVKFEVYEVVKLIGENYGKHENDIYFETIEEYSGKLLYSEEF